MTNLELSNEFDVLYNNITSNQAPGLDEYEKSVFLTKAQDEIVKAYFNPKTNKVQEGFDGSEKRQIDFSMLIRSYSYDGITYYINPDLVSIESITFTSISQIKEELTPSNDGIYEFATNYKIDNTVLNVVEDKVSQDGKQLYYVSQFFGSFFDTRDNTTSVTLDQDILMVINEYVEVIRDNNLNTRLTVIPINYIEYSRLMSKPYKRPLKNQAWRLLNNDSYRKAEIVIGPNDSIKKYVIRYIKRPRAIRLTYFEDVTLDGESTEQSCELDPILHPEILQRAVELAKAAYTGDLTSQVALGQNSQTNMGIVTQSR